MKMKIKLNPMKIVSISLSDLQYVDPRYSWAKITPKLSRNPTYLVGIFETSQSTDLTTEGGRGGIDLIPK